LQNINIVKSFKEAVFVLETFGKFDCNTHKDEVILLFTVGASRFKFVNSCSGRLTEKLRSVKELESILRFCLVITVEVKLNG
jgi:hypothetical protein